MVGAGLWRLSFTLANGEFNAGHVATCPDVAPECSSIPIEPHRHDVTHDVFHYELRADYGLRDRLQLSLGIPYDAKDIEVRYTTLDGRAFDPPYGDIHHRSESLLGISDPELMLHYEMPSTAGSLQLGGGLTFPLGEVSEDPIRLGLEGREHQHTQFGSGTVNPKLAVRWTRPVRRTLLAGYADVRISAWAADDGYRAPTIVRWSLGPSFPVRGIGISPLFVGQYQTYGRWNGEIEEGTGFHNGGIRLQAAFTFKDDWILVPAMYSELYSHGFRDEGFSQSTTWSLSLTRLLR